MTLSEFVNQLKVSQTLVFIEPNGNIVPSHFHITEVGLTTKHFIDCGGTERKEHTISFQLWIADDIDHRLSSEKLIGIIEKASSILGNQDHEVEIEYQGDTICRYGVQTMNNVFMMIPKQTDCLAKDSCGIPVVKKKVKLSELQSTNQQSCNPASGCC